LGLGIVCLTALSSGFAFSSPILSRHLSVPLAMEQLNQISLTPVRKGKIVSDEPVINAGQLWTDKPALVYVVRRPG